MKPLIERALLWFKDSNDRLFFLSEKYFGLSMLLTRLLNERYDGKKIKFININFRTEDVYNSHPDAPKHHTHYYGGHLNYDDVFDHASFTRLSSEDQKKYIWKRSFEVLQEASNSIKNRHLLNASEYAYNKGLETSLNPDYKMLEASLSMHGQLINASIWINFKEDGMYANLVLEKKGVKIFERNIDKAKNGVEFFLEMYTGLGVADNDILIKGKKDVDYLPLKIPIDPNIFND
jgi:hypothetical protein